LRSRGPPALAATLTPQARLAAAGTEQSRGRDPRESLHGALAPMAGRGDRVAGSARDRFAYPPLLAGLSERQLLAVLVRRNNAPRWGVVILYECRALRGQLPALPSGYPYPVVKVLERTLTSPHRLLRDTRTLEPGASSGASKKHRQGVWRHNRTSRGRSVLCLLLLSSLTAWSIKQTPGDAG